MCIYSQYKEYWFRIVLALIVIIICYHWKCAII